jgi:hypothetical protein
MLIGLSGAAGAGKDAVALALTERHNFKRFALATKMKECALAIDPIVDFDMTTVALDTGVRVRPIRLSELIEKMGPEKAKKHPEVRRLYQRIGTEMGRETISKDLWVKLVFELMADQRGRDVVISDVRFLNEADAIRRRGGFLWRVIRPGAGLEGEAAKHVSETELQDEDGLYDEIIHNDGTLEDLAAKAADALKACRSYI